MLRRPLQLVLFLLLVLVAGAALGVARADALSFATKVDYGTGSDPYSVAVGDFDGDGDEDLATANAYARTVSVLLGNGDGTFATKADYGTGSDSFSVAVGDFDGDGDEDLAVANSGANTVSVLLGNGDGTFATKADYGTGTRPNSVAVGDFDGDGDQDLATANSGAARVSVLLGNGDGTFATKVDYGTGSGPYSVTVGDFDGDGKQDLATTDFSVNSVSVLLGNGDGTFAPRVDYGTGSGPYSVTVGDFDGDGDEDLATANYGANTVSVLLGNGDGTFATKADYGTGTRPNSVTVGDFDGDGDEDLAVANYGAATVSVLLGNGDGTFAPKVDYGTGSGPSSVTVGDFDSDGKQDLATTDFSVNSVSVLLGKWEPPSGTMTIEGGAAATADRQVRIRARVAQAAQMRLRNSGGAWGVWQSYAANGFYTLPGGDGIKTVEAQYRNPISSTSLSASILLDTTAPTTTDNAPAAWQSASPVTVTLTGDDGAGSGVARTEYRLDGATSWTSGTSVAVTGDGTHTILYRSLDVAGNVGEIEDCTVKIDVAAPVTKVFGADPAWHRYPVAVAFAATDAISGVAKTQYSTDGGATWSQGTFLTVTAEGETTVSYRSLDVAGNAEAPNTVTVRVDTKAPTTSGAKVSARKNKKAVFRIKVSDPTPCSPDGAAVTITVKNAKGKTVKTLSFSNVTVNATVSLAWKKCGLKKGSYRYTVSATDAAGNAQRTAGGNRLVVK